MANPRSDSRFDDSFTVLITGVGRPGQVGEALAQAFADRGASLLLVDHSPERVEARAAALRHAGHRAEGRGGDLTDAAQLLSLEGWVRDRTHGRLDALVHAAGGFAATGPVAGTTFEDWQRMFAINATTAFLVTKTFLPLLRAARGTIVYFGSAAALPGASTAGVGAYAAAKGAVLSLARTVAAEERAHDVRANAVAPGTIRTVANEEAMGTDAPMLAREDVAAVVTWLCSESARAVTGEVVKL